MRKYLLAMLAFGMLICTAGDYTVQKVVFPAVAVVGGTASIRTNLTVHGEVDRVTIDQTANLTNDLTLTTSETPAESILVETDIGGDVIRRPTAVTHAAADGSAQTDYVPFVLCDEEIICTISNSVANTTNTVTVTIWIKN